MQVVFENSKKKEKVFYKMQLYDIVNIYTKNKEKCRNERE